jgi:hypothetical protein
MQVSFAGPTISPPEKIVNAWRKDAKMEMP